jgi:hypothetical protein
MYGGNGGSVLHLPFVFTVCVTAQDADTDP